MKNDQAISGIECGSTARPDAASDRRRCARDCRRPDVVHRAVGLPAASLFALESCIENDLMILLKFRERDSSQGVVAVVVRDGKP